MFAWHEHLEKMTCPNEQVKLLKTTIFKAFDCNRPLNVRTVYLDISKAFDRVWHDGLIPGGWGT